MQNPRTILIAGAGLGGAALAHGLTAAGHRVRIFDGDAGPDARPQGYRISINPMGQAALRALLPAAHLARLAALEVKDVGRGFTFASSAMKPLLHLRGDDDGVITVRRGGLRRLLESGL